MNHERAHSHASTSPTADLDADVAPGRASRADGLLGPTGPRPSGLLMRKAARDDNNVAAGADAAVGAASSSTGSALPVDLRSRFEGSLGTDLSSVRVHTGASSVDAASAVGAKAYTLGNDIHFGAGQFDPSSQGGQHLIAHEVAHTVQQRGGSPTRQNKLKVSSPGDHHEHEADRAADAMVSGGPATVGSASGLGRVVQRVAGKSAGVDGAISSRGATVNGNLGTSYSSALGELEATVAVKGTFSATLSWPDLTAGDEHESKAEGKPEAEGGKVEFVKERVLLEVEGSKKIHAEAERTWTEGFQVADVKYIKKAEFGGKTSKNAGGERKTESENVLSVGVEVTLKNGMKGSSEAKLFGTGVGAEGMEWSGPGVKVGFETRSFDVAADLSKGVRMMGSFKLGADASLTPNWKKMIGEKLMDGVKTGIRSLAAGALAEMVGFLAIGASVAAEFFIQAEALMKMKQAETAISAAIREFSSGALTALGVASPAGPYAQFWVQGQATYAPKMVALVVKLTHEFAADGFTGAEIQGALFEAAAKNAAAIRAKIEAGVRPGIADSYARAFYEKEKAPLYKFESDARHDANSISLHEGGSGQVAHGPGEAPNK